MAQETTAPSRDYKQSIVRVYSKSNRVIGAGFLVQGGYILTCAHVVRQALGKQDAQEPVGRTIKLKFPFVKGCKLLEAQVRIYWFKEEQVDIAALQLLEPAPAKATPIAFQCSHPWGQEFSVYGFPDGAMGRWASGQFKGECPREDDAPSWVQLEGTTTQGHAIKPGFSGAPIWNHEEAAVVGMAVARDKTEPDAKVAFMIPARAFSGVKQQFDCLSLSELLPSPEQQPQVLLHRAYELCCPQGWAEESRPESLETILAALQQIGRGDEDFEALERFVALLCCPELNPDNELRQQLEQWLEERLGNKSMLMESVRSLLSSPASEVAIKQESHLLIYVEDTSADAKPVRALFVSDVSRYNSQTGAGCDRLRSPGTQPFTDETVTLETLPSLVRACLNEVLRKANHKNIVVQLILPYSWLHQDCDRWSSTEPLLAALPIPIPSMPIGDDFLLVLRIAERLNPAVPELFRQKWLDKWEALNRLNPHERCSAFVAGEEHADELLIGALNQDCHLGLKRSTMCPEAERPSLFGALIATGIPAALLLRQDQVESLVADNKIDELLKDKINPLPEAVRLCRADARGKPKEKHIGHHLLLLWENPSLIPPTTTSEMPQAS